MPLDQFGTIVIVGPFSFPLGGAAARRILGNAKSLQRKGFDVVVASGQMANEHPAEGLFDGIKFVSLNERKAEHLPRFLKHLLYFTMGKKTVQWLDCFKEKPCAVILYSGYSPYILQILPWARRNNVRLIFDAVEWYAPSSFVTRFSPYQLNIEFAMRFLLPRIGYIISISTFLDNYYRKRFCRSIIIPPTLDVKNTIPSLDGRDTSSILNLVYAGTPGLKDRLDAVLEAVIRFRSKGFSVHINVAGVKMSEGTLYPAYRNSPMLAASCVTFLGVLSHNDTLDLVRSSDYSLILRKDARYSRAGFPTKFVESVALGTPVISNLTSDLASYIHDGITGFTCAGCSPIDAVAALEKAYALTRQKHSYMRASCRDMALEFFDFRVYSDDLANFIQSREN